MWRHNCLIAMFVGKLIWRHKISTLPFPWIWRHIAHKHGGFVTSVKNLYRSALADLQRHARSNRKARAVAVEIARCSETSGIHSSLHMDANFQLAKANQLVRPTPVGNSCCRPSTRPIFSFQQKVGRVDGRQFSVACERPQLLRWRHMVRPGLGSHTPTCVGRA